jgi:type IV secretory pathway TrbD component
MLAGVQIMDKSVTTFRKAAKADPRIKAVGGN